MATRSGALDPGAVAWLAANTTDDLSEVLERQGGLLGLCGTADMREVIARADEATPTLGSPSTCGGTAWWGCARPWPPRSAVSTSSR